MIVRTDALTAPERQRAGFGVKLLYGVGEIANAIKTVLFGLFTLFFYTSVMGLPGALVGVAAAIGLLADAVLDPYFGYLSDRARCRLGRRHTFMLAGALTMGASLWAFFSPPRGASTAYLFAWLFVTGSLVRITTSLFSVPYFALGAELSEDYHERTQITAIRGGLALLGTLLAAGLSFSVFFPNTTPGVDPKLDYAGYPAMGLSAGVIMTLAAAVAFVATLPWRSRYGGGETSTAAAQHGFLVGFRQSMRSAAFRSVFLSVSLFFFAVVVNSVLSIYFVTYYARITDSSALSGFQLAFYLGGLVGVASWLVFGRNVAIEKQPLYVLSAVVTGLLMLAAYVLLGEGHALGTGNVKALLLGHGLAGFSGSALWFMPASMIADVADEDELATGKRQDGLFFGIFFFGQKLAASLAALVAGILIDWYAGLLPAAAQQATLTIRRIGLVYSVVPGLVLLLAAGLIIRYPLSKARVTAIRTALRERDAVHPRGAVQP
jgi:GPH family glycoside/pentoside/hexuronide:cation symporter